MAAAAAPAAEQTAAATAPLKIAIPPYLRKISKPAIRRLARRSGVKMMGFSVYPETRIVAQKFLDRVLRDTITCMEYAKRHTVSSTDVMHALQRQGRPIYGF